MGFVLSVVINDFDGVGFSGMPAKADAPLVINPDAQLPVAVLSNRGIRRKRHSVSTIRSANSLSRTPRGESSAKTDARSWSRSSGFSSFRWMFRAVSPCAIALRPVAYFSSAVLGPVLNSEFLRFASIRRWLAPDGA
jgi:hypothetical protein